MSQGPRPRTQEKPGGAFINDARGHAGGAKAQTAGYF